MTTGGGSNLGEATLRLSADAKGLNKDLAQVEKSTAQRLGNVGKTLTKTLTPAALGIGAAVFTASEQINEAFATIRTGTGATGETLEGLQEDFKAVYGSVPADSQTVAAAIAEVNTRLGLSGEALQEVTKTALELADATGGDATDAIKKTVQAMKVFDREGEDAAETMDKFFVVAQDTGITVDELTSQMQTFGPVLRNAGFSMDEATAIFGQLNAEGVDASRVFPGLNAFFRRTAEAGGDMRQSFEEVTSRIQNATSNTEALNIATEAFGAEGAQRLVVAVQNGAFEIDEMVGSLENASGAVLQNAEDTRTATERFAMMRREVGEKLAGAFQSLPGPAQAAAAGLTGAAAAAGPLLTALPGIVTATKALNLANLKNAATSATATAATIVRTVATVAGTVATTAATVAATAFGVALTIATGPIGLIVLAIAGLVAAAILIWKNWDTVREKTIEIWNKVKKFLSDTWDKIVGFIKENWDKILAILFPAVGLAVLIVRNWGKIKEKVSEILGAVFGFFGDLWGKITGWFVEHSLVGLIISNWGAIKEVIGNIFDAAAQRVKDAVNAMIGFINAVISVWNDFELRVPEVKIGPVKFGGYGIGTPNIPLIPTLAEGGIVQMPQLAMVGEAGPEAIIPLDRLASMMNGGRTMVFNVENLYGVDDLEDFVQEANLAALRRGQENVLT